jgi:hypothetical protein
VPKDHRVHREPQVTKAIRATKVMPVPKDHRVHREPQVTKAIRATKVMP